MEDFEPQSKVYIFNCYYIPSRQSELIRDECRAYVNWPESKF